MTKDIVIETTVDAPLDRVWSAWTTPGDIRQWNFASDEWHCPAADIHLRAGGTFTYRMEAKNGSTGFNFGGTFAWIGEHQSIEYALDDDRKVSIAFSETEQRIRVVETYEAEDELSAKYQRQGWWSILDNFKKHVERTSNHGKDTVEG